MFDFNKPKIEITELSEDKKFGRFVVEPLERGYGTTLGNSLRRIMLSSLPGPAVSQVKIDGVLHEFSSIPGVKEDVSDIIMNLKSLAIKNHSTDNEPKTAYIECEGKGVVTAADIQADQDIEIMNPDQVIATLNGGKDCRLAMELTITKGRGYISADKGKSDDMPIGVLAVDAIYTPVDRVNMTVENTRVGQVTDYDKLTLDVYTNGTLDPDEAVSLAAKVLSEHLSLFIDLSENAKTAEVMIEKEDNEKEKVLEMNIDELELSVRSYNCLKRAGINTVEELCNKTAESADKREQLLCNKSYGFIGIYLLVEHLGNSALGNLQNGEKNIFNSADRPVDSLLGSADGILNLGALHSVNVGFFVRRIGYGKSSRFADSAVKRCGRFLLRKGIEPCRHNGHYHAQAKYNAQCFFKCFHLLCSPFVFVKTL